MIIYIYLRLAILLSMMTLQPLNLIASDDSGDQLWRYSRKDITADRFDFDYYQQALVRALETLMYGDTMRLYCDGAQYLTLAKRGSDLSLTITRTQSSSEEFAWLFGTDAREVILDSNRDVCEVRSSNRTMKWLDSSHFEYRYDGEILSVWSIERTNADSVPVVTVQGRDKYVYSRYELKSEHDSVWLDIDVTKPLGMIRSSVILKKDIVAEVGDYGSKMKSIDGNKKKSIWTDKSYCSSEVSADEKVNFFLQISWNSESLSCSCVYRWYDKPVLISIQLYSISPGVLKGSISVTRVDEYGGYERKNFVLTAK